MNEWVASTFAPVGMRKADSTFVPEGRRKIARPSAVLVVLGMRPKSIFSPARALRNESISSACAVYSRHTASLKAGPAAQAAEKLGRNRPCNKGTASACLQTADNKGSSLAPAGCFRLFDLKQTLFPQPMLPAGDKYPPLPPLTPRGYAGRSRQREIFEGGKEQLRLRFE